MKLKTLESADLDGKTVLYRAPYDIELKNIDGDLEVVDDTRIEVTLPTIRYLLEKKCKIVILTYVGRPDGKIVKELRTDPHAKKLSELLNHPVEKIDDCIGSLVEKKISHMNSSEILMLENVRFYKEEMVDDDEFAKKLCKGKDLIVFDGFPQAHRIHASTTGIERHLPSVAGFYLQHEVEMLSGPLEKPARPFTVIVGGAKISDKVDAIRNLLKMADNILVGGAVANVFLKAQGRTLGSSFIEDVFVDKAKRENKDWVQEARGILQQAKILEKRVFVPRDFLISDGTSFKNIDVAVFEIPEEWKALDIGEKTQKEFSEIISQSETIFMNGPMGKFENEKFAQGTKAIFDAIKNTKGKTIIAGGDTINAARKYGELKNYSHVSLAGGATLEFLAGKELPALIPLMK